jgi:hypothetical protein
LRHSFRKKWRMLSRVRLSLAIPLFLAMALPCLAGEVVVATRQVKLQTSTFLFKLPVEAQRGERWEVVKRGKKVKLTFGPQDERRRMVEAMGMKKPLEYELDAAAFSSSFVPEVEWPASRRALATELQRRFDTLSGAECERIVEGEVWVGMRREHAAEAVGNRLFQKEARETQEGTTETWRVGAFSLLTTAESAVKGQILEETVTARPSKLAEPFAVRAARDFEANTRLVLTFKDGALTEVVRR